VNLQLMDTAGQESYDRIRTLCYENTQCFVVAFSVVDTVSFKNVREMWLKEVRSNQPSAKILLVGTKSDLRGAKKEEVAAVGGGAADRYVEVSGICMIHEAVNYISQRLRGMSSFRRFIRHHPRPRDVGTPRVPKRRVI
jgi:GTPase SAR1 family protein